MTPDNESTKVYPKWAVEKQSKHFDKPSEN
jgi:hypothetical protein